MPLRAVGADEGLSLNYDRDEDASAASSSRSFAPTAPLVLDPVYITPPPSPPRIPVPAPGIVQIVGDMIGTVIRRIPFLVPFIPGNTGPDGTGDLVQDPDAVDFIPTTPRIPQLEPPDPLEALPELDPVYITPPPRPPAATNVGNDPIMPPNWNDLADPGDQIFDGAPGLKPKPIPLTADWPTGPDDRPTPNTPGDPGELPDDFGFDLTTLLDAPGGSVRVDTLPKPTSFLLDPFGLANPFAFGSPRPGTRPSTRPRVVTAPGDPDPTPNPVGNPFPVIPGIPDDYRPALPAPGGTSLPDFFSNPNPSLTDDPMADPWGNTDQPTSDDACQCDKPPKKKKKPKKKRDVCKQGTYTQRAKGIKYSPKRTVPCEGVIERERKSAAPKKSKPKKRRYPTSLPDLYPLTWS